MHSFASLLLHGGRSPIYVAQQLGHGAELTMRTYGHVIDGSRTRRAFRRRRRSGGHATRHVPDLCLDPLAIEGREREIPASEERPDQDSNLGPTP